MREDRGRARENERLLSPSDRSSSEVSKPTNERCSLEVQMYPAILWIQVFDRPAMVCGRPGRYTTFDRSKLTMAELRADNWDPVLAMKVL